MGANKQTRETNALIKEACFGVTVALTDNLYNLLIDYENRVAVLTKALVLAEQFVVQEREQWVADNCVHTDGGPDLATLDRHAKPIVRRIEGLIAKINGALARTRR